MHQGILLPILAQLGLVRELIIMYTTLQSVWDELSAEGGPFEIEEILVRGSPMKTFKSAPPSLREIWLASAIHGDRDYLVYEDQRWSYTEVHRMVGSIAAWMANENLVQGDRVAIALRNYPEWMICYWAAVASGLTVVGMNAWWIENELDYAMHDAMPKILFCDEQRLNRFNAIRENHAQVKVVGIRLTEPADQVFNFAEIALFPGELPDTVVQPDEDACIFYTSGTTGRPKGAQQTHRGCVHNIMNMGFWGQCLSQTMSKLHGTASLDPQQAPPISALVTTPLFHVTANNCLAQASTVAGGKLVHMYKWDATVALQLIEKERISNLTGVPVMSRELISHPDFSQYDTSSLISVGGGGAQLQPDLVSKIDKAISTARPGTGYGMTETCGIITSIGGDFFIENPESCGRAMPSFEVKTVDSDGSTTMPGEPGELWVRGAAVIKGYLNQAEATSESLTDGWLHTGDVARIDENDFIYIVDRVKDMVLRGGENIYCSEVETVLFQMDQIAECSVFGIADDRLGEEVGVAIYCREQLPTTAEQVRDFCNTRMAKHKIPRYIWMLDEPLPRNASGKFLKRELQGQLPIDQAQ